MSEVTASKPAYEITVGIRKLKAHLSQYLKYVKDGDTIVITDRGKPVGRIVPIEQTLEEKVQMLRESGEISWSGKRLQPRTPQEGLQGDYLASDLLLEDRR